MNAAPAPARPPARRAYVVGASKERMSTVGERLRRDGFDVCGHCDHPREFRPPRDLNLVLLITDMGNHAAIRKAREYCRARGVPCVGGLWRTWSTTRERLMSVAARANGCCPGCPMQGCCRS